jgi:hypothetical protein
MSITVVNRHYHAASAQDIYIGRPSSLGNPFVIGKDGNREEVINKYKAWISGQMKSNNRIKNALAYIVKRVKDGDAISLVCYCAPQLCHGDIIKSIIEQALQLKEELR